MAPFDFGALRAPTLRANGIFPVFPNRDRSFRRTPRSSHKLARQLHLAHLVLEQARGEIPALVGELELATVMGRSRSEEAVEPLRMLLVGEVLREHRAELGERRGERGRFVRRADPGEQPLEAA